MQILRNFEIPLPSLEEQKAIARKLDKVSGLIEKRKTQLEKLSELVKSRFIEMFGDPVYNPNRLPTKPLAELGSLDRGRSKHRPRNDTKLLGGPYPLIQTGEVSNAGLYITEYQNTYSELGLQQSKMWNAGTLCITIAANIAQTAILTFNACFPDSVVGFIPSDEIDAIYMHYWFSFFQKILDEQAPQVAQKNINLKILSELQVTIPSKEAQQEFVAFVKQTDKSKYIEKISVRVLTIFWQKVYIWN
jgi:type I restriction enzyme S subunit